MHHDVSQSWFSSVRHCIKLGLDGGGHVDWELANPNLLLTLMLQENGALQEVFARALRKHPCSR